MPQTVTAKCSSCNEDLAKQNLFVNKTKQEIDNCQLISANKTSRIADLEAELKTTKGACAESIASARSKFEFTKMLELEDCKSTLLMQASEITNKTFTIEKLEADQNCSQAMNAQIGFIMELSKRLYYQSNEICIHKTQELNRTIGIKTLDNKNLLQELKLKNIEINEKNEKIHKLEEKLQSLSNNIQ